MIDTRPDTELSEEELARREKIALFNLKMYEMEHANDPQDDGFRVWVRKHPGTAIALALFAVIVTASFFLR